MPLVYHVLVCSFTLFAEQLRKQLKFYIVKSFTVVCKTLQFWEQQNYNLFGLSIIQNYRLYPFSTSVCPCVCLFVLHPLQMTATAAVTVYSPNINTKGL